MATVVGAQIGESPVTAFGAKRCVSLTRSAIRTGTPLTPPSSLVTCYFIENKYCQFLIGKLWGLKLVQNEKLGVTLRDARATT